MLGLLLGIVLLLVGAHFFVRGAVALARRLGVTPHLIGLTLVAWGGALPELVTALWRRTTVSCPGAGQRGRRQ
ncbi:MAG: hypothetical protein U1E97_07210 [Alphaproteobacteria bacterium]